MKFTHILMTMTDPENKQIDSRYMPVGAFNPHRGVRTVLDLDPTSTVLVRKEGGLEVSYKFENPPTK